MEKVIMYTDGGCRGNQVENNVGGWGVVIKYKEQMKELYGNDVNTTNNKMELTAVIEGLKALKVNTVDIEVYLDSNYVLQGITQWIHNWKKKGWKTASKKPVENKELWIELDDLRNQFNSVEFIKVKGHAGVELNELADQLVNRAMDEIESSNDKVKIEDVSVEEDETKTVTIWEKLKLQIDNLELLHKESLSGKDVSTQVYWQSEYIQEFLKTLESEYGADKVRENYESII